MKSYTIIGEGRQSYPHPNVSRMMWFCGVFGIASAIAQMGVFDTYLYMRSNDSNSAVGLAESVCGITQVIMVWPAGIIADRCSRSLVLRGCVILSLLYVVASIFGVYYDNTILIYISLILGGVYLAIQNSASFALFSDSIPQGERASWMSKVAVITQIAMGVGPLLGYFLFKYFGDVWDLSVLHSILIIGFLLMIPANMFLANWSDIPKGMFSPIVVADSAPLLSSGPSSISQSKIVSPSIVPYIVCMNDIITCIGAGMTVKFFPLFFKNDYGFNPTDLQLLFTIYCFAFALFTWACEKVASKIGRVQSSMIFSLCGVVCLFALAYLESLPLVVCFFVLRGAFQNAIYPIDRSIIMDFVPSDQRGRWNSIESISAMTWSGSAVIGGYLMDSHDYRYTFVITGWIYLVACCLRTPLLFLVPKNEKFSDIPKVITQAHAAMMASPLAPSPKQY